MDNIFLNREQSLQMMDYGFDEPTYSYWFGKDPEPYYGSDLVPTPFNPRVKTEKPRGGMFRRPTYEQVFNWFYEKHNIYVSIEPNWDIKDGKGVIDCFIVTIYENQCHEPIEDFKTIEDAKKRSIGWCLGILEKRKNDGYSW